MIMMKDAWKNNLGLKIMAVCFSVILWWAVVNVDDPVRTNNYSVEVFVKNPQVVTNAGKSYKIDDSLRNIKVSVKARRKVLDELKASDISATADLLEMDTSTGVVPIRVEIKGHEYIEATASPRNIQIAMEETQKKTFPIQVATAGNVQDGFVLDKENTVAAPKSIDISGPKSSLLRISRVVAKVDVSELSRDSLLQAEVIYYDSADNIIDKSVLSSNCDKNGVTVNVKLLRTKEVEVRFDTAEIKPAEGYLLKALEVEPQRILIAGQLDKVSGLQYISVDKAALRQENIAASKDIVVDLADYLPEGIRLVNEEASTVVVRILLEEIGTKSLMLPVRSVKVNGALEKFDIAYGPAQEVELKFSGTNEILDSLTSEKIIAAIDLSKFIVAGTYDVPVQILEAPEGCAYVSEAVVQITLTEKEDIKEENEDATE